VDQAAVAAVGTSIMRLLAIARGLEDDGQYNVAKLFRAAAFAECARSTRAPARVGSGLLEEMAAVIADLRSSGSRAPLDAMDDALAALRRGEMPTLEAFSEPWACRYCGQVMLGCPPAFCPSCRSRSLTFEPFPPIFYLQTLPPDELLRVLADNLADVREIIQGTSESMAEFGVWPLRDILAHLRGSEQLLTLRARRMLDEDDPVFTSVAPADIGAADDEQPTLAGMLEDFTELRRHTIARLAGLQPDAWQRRGYHPEWGWMTVQQQISYLARHEQSHLAELEATADGREWLPGDNQDR
jgi:rubrerythrin